MVGVYLLAVVGRDIRYVYASFIARSIIRVMYGQIVRSES